MPLSDDGRGAKRRVSSSGSIVFAVSFVFLLPAVLTNLLIYEGETARVNAAHI